MTEPLPDTWNTRDYLVLREGARLLDADESFAGVPLHDIATSLGMDPAVVLKSCQALEYAGLVEFRWVMPSTHGRLKQISGRARQLVGQWPSEEQALDRIIAALLAIAEATDDEDERTKAQRFAAWLRTSASTVGLSVASAAITGQLPGQ